MDMSGLPQNPTDDVRKLNPHLYGPQICAGNPTSDFSTPDHIQTPPKPGKRLRQSQKPLLNGLETEFLGRIKQDHCHFYPQSVRFRLCNGMTYTPDIMVVDMTGRVRCYEVKGPHAWEDSILK